MSRLKWLPAALEDLARLHRFLDSVSVDAAQRAAGKILEGANTLEQHPELGQPMADERREWFIPFAGGAYVLRHRIDAGGDPVVIRVWHSRESRT